jgi:hypothetical protein
MCQSDGQATNGKWAGVRIEKRTGTDWALWARKCVAADGAEEEANEIMLASYLLGFA